MATEGLDTKEGSSPRRRAASKRRPRRLTPYQTAIVRALTLAALLEQEPARAQEIVWRWAQAYLTT